MGAVRVDMMVFTPFRDCVENYERIDEARHNYADHEEEEEWSQDPSSRAGISDSTTEEEC